MKAIVVVLILAACSRGEHRVAREKYNQGVDLLVKGDHEAAEKILLEARSTAGVDPELRFRAAYDLGMAYAAHAEKLKTGDNPDLAKALELAEQSVNWFADAARLRKDDADTKANLAIMRARAQSLSDELRKGEGKLEARLDAVIGEQRTVLEEARRAWLAIKETGGTDPLAQQSTLTSLADKERGVVAEAGVIGDLAAEEIDAIGQKVEDKRSDEEKVRVIQLKNLELYLIDGRNRIAEARRKLQDLAAEEAVARAESALVSLKRAREQLLDPITVLREVARDELALMQQTQIVVEAESGKLLEATPAGEKPLIPAWLDAPALADRQGGLRDRVEEVRARLAAAVEGPPPAQPPPEDQQKLLDRVRIALPNVTEASAAMERARTKLGEKKLKDAAVAERESLIALAKAIEQFADLKQTIDIASETQKQLVTLLSPESAKKLPAAERTSETKDALAQNIARMTRIKELLVDEVAKLAQQEQLAAQAAAGSGSAAPPGAGSAAPPDPKQLEAAKQQLEGMKQQMAQAEVLRADAEKLIAQLDAALKTNKDPLTPAKAADTKLDELRRLFFSVIEHLKDLIRQQGETRDQTSQAHADVDDTSRATKVPPIATRQDQHNQLAKAITDALAAQADTAAKAQDPQQQQQAKNMAAAADEVRLAQNDMTDAKGTLDKVVTVTTQSHSLEPATKAQASAIQHLENALRLLQPPQQQQNKDQKQDPQQDKKKEEQQQQGGAAQRARDEDARRQRDRNKQPSGDAVEMDW